MTKIKTITEIKTKPNIITIIKTITKTTNIIKTKTKTKTKTNTMTNTIIKTVTNIITTTDIKTMASSKTKIKTKTKMPIPINFIDIFDIFIEITQTKSKQNLTLRQLLILREANKKIKEKSDIIQPYAEAEYSTYGYNFYNTTEGENKFHKKKLKEIEKSYDMFKHFKIISLEINDERGYNLEYINSIINLISNQQNLICINLISFQFQDKFEKFFNLLTQCQFLNNLILSNVLTSSYEFTKLANVLIQCPVLTHLDINSCGIEFEFESLSKEDISENIKILTGAIPQCKMLTNLIFSHNKLGPGGLLKFASMFSQCTNITSLDISQNNDPYDIVDLVSFIGVPSWSTSLVHIDLSENGIGRLGQVFSECSSLTSLDLSSNHICTTNIEESEDLQQVFKHCTKLVTLKLFANEIDDKEFINLSKVLSHCTSLKELNISANNITNYTSLPLCTQLNYLNISLNNFNYNEIANIGEVLSPYKALTKLDLSNIKLSDNGLISFSKTLPEYRLLKKLDLSKNGISSIGIISLVSVLSQCKLKKINLAKNNIDESGLVCLKQSAKLNNINLRWKLSHINQLFQRN